MNSTNDETHETSSARSWSIRGLLLVCTAFAVCFAVGNLVLINGDGRTAIVAMLALWPLFPTLVRGTPKSLATQFVFTIVCTVPFLPHILIWDDDFTMVVFMGIAGVDWSSGFVLLLNDRNALGIMALATPIAIAMVPYLLGLRV